MDLIVQLATNWSSTLRRIRTKPPPVFFGIRMALGATPQTVLWAVLRRAVRLLGLGIVSGLTAGVMLAAVVQRLFEVSLRDPRICVVAGLGAVFVGIV